MELNFNEIIKQNNLPKIGSKVLVAMSGGVDSSVTAAILKSAGYDVIGITMKLHETKSAKSSKTCCSGVDIADARNVSKKLAIKHYVIDLQDRFKESVINDFVNSYKNGETPIPCIRCNQTVKFVDLLNFAKKVDCKVLATGHYIKRVETKTGINLFRAEDDKKDQSYFLFATTQEQLKVLRFPLGYFSKSKIRDLAKFFGLSVANKKDSQDICFVPSGNYKKFLRKNLNAPSKKGNIETTEGKTIGVHSGITDFTVGQRKGLGVGGIKGINSKDPYYVLDIDKVNNKIIVGPKIKLAKYLIYLKEINFISNNLPSNSFSAFVKIRSRNNLISAKVKYYSLKNKTATVELDKPEYGVAPGQACVFYNNKKRIIGGGWIFSGEKVLS